MQIQFDRLEDVAAITERAPPERFKMSEIWCGTAGCMIGNYNWHHNRSLNTFGTLSSDWMHFGISRAEYLWLFDARAHVYSTDKDSYKCWHSPFRDLRHVTREQAISRLRKFIAYKRRKHDLIHDEKFGVSERSRHAEGNHNIVMLAKMEVAEAMALATAN